MLAPLIGGMEMCSSKCVDMKPASIVARFHLKDPVFGPTAAYGHMGREPKKAEIDVYYSGKKETKEVQLFAWEKLDYVEKIKASFQLEKAEVQV